jgi:hypothetical protein
MVRLIEPRWGWKDGVGGGHNKRSVAACWGGEYAASQCLSNYMYLVVWIQ